METGAVLLAVAFQSQGRLEWLQTRLEGVIRGDNSRGSTQFFKHASEGWIINFGIVAVVDR